VAALHGRLVRHTAAGGDDPLFERTTVAAPLEHGVRASVGRHEAEAAAQQHFYHHHHQLEAPRPAPSSPPAASTRAASHAGGSPVPSFKAMEGGPAHLQPPQMSAAVAAAFAAGGGGGGGGGGHSGHPSRRPTMTDAGRGWGGGAAPPAHHRTASTTSTHDVTAPPASTQPGPPVVRMGRREAWARFLAYEASWQVCLRAAGERSPDAAPFLADGCGALRKAFGFGGLLLSPAGPDAPPAGAALAWDDAEAAVLPTVGFKPEVTRTAAIKVAVSRVAAADLRARARAHATAAVGGGGGGLGGLLRPSDASESIPVSATLAAGTGLAVCLRPTRWGGSDVDGDGTAVAEVNGDGRAPRGDVLELGPGDMGDDLLVEVRAGGPGGALVASGLVPVGDVWSAAGADGEGRAAGGAGEGAAADPPDRERRGGGDRAAGKGGKLLGLLARAAGGGHHVAADAGHGGAGKKWVTLYDTDGARYGHACLGAWICTQETTVIATAAIRGDRVAAAAGPSGAGLGAGSAPGGGLLRVTAWQVYDVALAAALRAQGCGPRRLAVSGEWAWLLRALAGTYGVRPSYAALAHARWAVTRANATPTAYCLSLLGSTLGPLKAQEAAGSLLPQEAAILASVEREVVALLAATLEAYHSLSESAPGGVLEGGGGAPDVPPPALLPAVELAGILRDGLRPSPVAWLASRFRAAAVRRYAALETACDAAAAPFAARVTRQEADDAGAPSARHPSHPGGVTSADADAYARLEALASAIQAELSADLAIHDAAVLPAFINLPQVAAAEYGRALSARLTAVLADHPPPEPSPPAVDLLVAIGRQQEFLAWHNLAPPAGHPGALDALAVFGPHVGAWIDRSRRGLVLRCRELEATTVATAPAAAVGGGGGLGGPGGGHEAAGDGRGCAAPLVEEVLALTGAEVGRYERVVTYWPLFAPAVEGAACAALREATAAVSRQCGLTQVPDGSGGAGDPGGAPWEGGAGGGGGPPPHSPGRWKWRAAPPAAGAARLTVAPHEAVLLNSLRRLLVVAPAMEHLLDGWARGEGEGDGEEGEGGEGAGPPAPPSRAAASPGRRPGGRAGTASPPPRGGRAAAAAAARAGDDPRAGPALGAQLAQLVKELRCEYASAVTSTAGRIARGVFSLPGRSVRRALEAHGSAGAPGAAQQALGPALEVLEEVLLGLARSLEGRVYVAVGRGLWDHCAGEVLAYVEGLQEGGGGGFGVGPAPPGAPGGVGGGAALGGAGGGGGTRDAWRGRQAAAACLEVVDTFFSAVLAGTLAHDLSGRDLDLPASSARAHRLLDRNTDAATASYTVF